MLALTDETLISVSRVVNAARGDANDGVEQCDPQVITQASSLSTFFLSFIFFKF